MLTNNFLRSAFAAALQLIVCVNAATGAETPVPVPQVKTKNITTARVVSCGIVFPLDAVRFSEHQVDECMKSVKVSNVSYIHVIATSSATGSSAHNLYLSNRRAGAIEAYLVNRYPDITVHAFGGGVNPKFGKMARIFIVENQDQPQEDESGVQIASIGAPEIIEKTTVQVVTKTEYKDPPRKSVDVVVDSGPARTGFSDDPYNYVGVRVSALGKVPFFPSLTAGISHKMLQSNEVVDLNVTGIDVARTWTFGRILGQEIFHEQSLGTGLIRANGSAWEYGTTGAFGVRNRDYRMSLQAAKTSRMMSLGLGLGIRM